MYNIPSMFLTHSLFTSVICCFLFVTNISAFIADESIRQNKEWVEIERQYERGWKEREALNFGESEKRFRLAIRKLEQYRARYIKDHNSLSFLRATYMLGNFCEFGNDDTKAQKYYRQTLAHPLTNSNVALPEANLIVQYAKKRLSIVDQRLMKPHKSSTKDYPRISIKGGSKSGERDLPEREALFRP